MDFGFSERRPFSHGTDAGTGGSDPDTGGDHDDFISGTVNLPVDEVKEFVDAFIGTRADLINARPIWAEKMLDAIKGERGMFTILA